VNELIFFAVIILFTVIEAITKARKKRAEDGEEADGEVSDRERLARRSGPREREDEPSETMIPADIWEEIAGLGRGRREPDAEPTELAPAPTPAPTPVPYGSAGRRAPAPYEGPRGGSPGPKRRTALAPGPTRLPSVTEAHRIHRLHPDLGTDPSERTRSEQDWRPEVRDDRNAKRVRALLRGSEGTDALKQAVILREVLGPPVSMRGE
jgi:hypothetical protein